MYVWFREHVSGNKKGTIGGKNEILHGKEKENKIDYMTYANNRG